MTIQILDLRLLPGNKATRAFCDVTISGIVVRDFRVYQTNGKPSVRNPFTTHKHHDGKFSFRQTIDLPSNVQAEVNALILTEFFRRLKEQENDDRPH